MVSPRLTAIQQISYSWVNGNDRVGGLVGWNRGVLSTGTPVILPFYIDSTFKGDLQVAAGKSNVGEVIGLNQGEIIQIK